MRTENSIEMEKMLIRNNDHQTVGYSKKKKKFAVQSAFVLYLILSLTDFFVVSILDVR